MVFVTGVCETHPLQRGVYVVFVTGVLSASDDHVLKVLNSGSTKDLQSLQTIGLKRARQIVTWQTLHGRFNEVSYK